MDTDVRIVFFAGGRVLVGEPAVNLTKEAKAVADAVDRTHRHHRGRLRVADTIHDVTLDELIAGILRNQPQVVHFGGHGVDRELLLLSPDGSTANLSSHDLRRVLSNLPGRLRLLVLTACHSHSMAADLTQGGVVDYAVGVKGKISDEDAQDFARAFYECLGNGLPIKNAFELAGVRQSALELSQAPSATGAPLIARGSPNAGRGPDQAAEIPRAAKLGRQIGRFAALGFISALIFVVFVWKPWKQSGVVDPRLVGSWSGSGPADSIYHGCCTERLSIEADGTATVAGTYHTEGTCSGSAAGNDSVSCSQTRDGQLVTQSLALVNVLLNYSYNMFGAELPGQRSVQTTNAYDLTTLRWSRNGSSWKASRNMGGVPWNFALQLDGNSHFDMLGTALLRCSIQAKNGVFHLTKGPAGRHFDGTYEIKTPDWFETTVASSDYTKWTRLTDGAAAMPPTADGLDGSETGAGQSSGTPLSEPAQATPTYFAEFCCDCPPSYTDRQCFWRCNALIPRCDKYGVADVRVCSANWNSGDPAKLRSALAACERIEKRHPPANNNLGELINYINYRLQHP